MRFFQFGCWNNLNEKKGKVVGRLKYVMAKLKQMAKPDFIIVSGDNYYPGKEKVGEVKNKMVFFDKLIEGFDTLPSEIPIYMILGNHDLETQSKKKSNLFIKGDIDRYEDGKCEILRKEKCVVDNKRNIQYNSFTYKVHENTLILMVDTSMYEFDKDVEKYLSCYNVFFSPEYYFTNVNQLRNYQLKQIIDTITEVQKDKDIIHIIIVGHHPIYCYKTKEEENEIDGVKRKIRVSRFESDIIYNFRSVLKRIYNKITNTTCKYYYLCSDLHLYQEGTIHLNVNHFRNTKPMEIQQYIVGNGGTELDLKSIHDYTRGSHTHTFEEGDTYECKKEVDNHGFLECIVGSPELTFIPHFVEISGGKRKTIKNMKRKKGKSQKKKFTYYPYHA